jgi:hypothetical protein
MKRFNSRVGRWSVALSAALSAFGALPWAAHAANTFSATDFAGADIAHAVWRQQEIPFVYQGYNTRYSCDALQLKVKQVLGAVAVHDSTTITPTGCSMIGPTSQIASMQISIVSAAPLNDATRAEFTARSSQQELLDRLGVRQELGQEFVAQWREVDIARQLRFEAGDCEFLRQFGDQVLSRMAVKVIASEGPCAVTPPRFKQARLKVRALAPVSIDSSIPMSMGESTTQSVERRALRSASR